MFAVAPKRRRIQIALRAEAGSLFRPKVPTDIENGCGASFLNAVRRGELLNGGHSMKHNPSARQPFLNSILSGLSRDAYARFDPHLELVSLQVGEVLIEAGGAIKNAYFLNSG